MIFLDTNEEDRDVDTISDLLVLVGVPNLPLCLPTENEVAVEKDDAKAAATKRRNIIFLCKLYVVVSFKLV